MSKVENKSQVVKKELSPEAKQLLYYFTGIINSRESFIHHKKFCVITEWPLKYLAIQNDGVLNKGHTLTKVFNAFFELQLAGYKIMPAVPRTLIDDKNLTDVIIYCAPKELTIDNAISYYIEREAV